MSDPSKSTFGFGSAFGAGSSAFGGASSSAFGGASSSAAPTAGFTASAFGTPKATGFAAQSSTPAGNPSAAPGPGLFGGPPTTTTTNRFGGFGGSGLFNNAAPSASSTVGSSSQAAPPTTGFGTLNSFAPAVSGPFAKAPTTNATPFQGFGQTTPASNGGLFGGGGVPAASGSAPTVGFGTAAPSSTSLFTTAAAAPTGTAKAPLFGNVAPTSGTTPGLFGNTPSGFSSTPAGQKPEPPKPAFGGLAGAGGLLGGKPPTTTFNSTATPSTSAAPSSTTSGPIPPTAPTPATTFNFNAPVVQPATTSAASVAPTSTTATSAPSATATTGAPLGPSFLNLSGAPKPTTTAPTAGAAAMTTAPAVAPTVTAPAPPGLKATLNSSISGPKPDAASKLKNKSMDDIVTQWATDLSKYQKEFQSQAEKVAKWDNLLVSASDKVAELYSDTYTNTRDITELEKQLHDLETRQKEVDSVLDSFEREVHDMMVKGGIAAFDKGTGLQGVDQERGRTYKLAEKATDRVGELHQDVLAVTEEINAITVLLNRTSKVDDPLSQIVHVLEGHLAQLQVIDTETSSLREKIVSSSKAASQAQSTWAAGFGMNDGVHTQDFYQSFRGLK